MSKQCKLPSHKQLWLSHPPGGALLPGDQPLTCDSHLQGHEVPVRLLLKLVAQRLFQLTTSHSHPPPVLTRLRLLLLLILQQQRQKQSQQRPV